MINSLFSERYGFAPQPDPKPDDHLPGWIREAITNEIRVLVNNQPTDSLPDGEFYALFRPYVWQVLDSEPPSNPLGGPWKFYIPKTLQKCTWWQFYDILELISKLANQQWGDEYSQEFSSRVNTLLAREGIPWKMEKSEVIRALAPMIQEQIGATSALLANPRFKGPDEQFRKAIDSLNQRPEPDEENCVKDSVGALEAVANIVACTT